MPFPRCVHFNDDQTAVKVRLGTKERFNIFPRIKNGASANGPNGCAGFIGDVDAVVGCQPLVVGHAKAVERGGIVVAVYGA